MEEIDFRRAVCQQYQIKESKYVSFVLGRALFRRVHLVRPLVQFFNADYLFNERRLVEKVAGAKDLRDIQAEVDFYQHKYVVNFLMKETFQFRLSGMRLMSLANKAFIHANNGSTKSDRFQVPVKS
jgi:hypothetical protein